MSPSSFKFTLYVAGENQNSVRALANLTAICKEHLRNRYHIEVVDVFKAPQRALDDGVFLTPTVVKLAPLPRRTIVGCLSETDPVLHAFGLASSAK